jgi:hypothetical protein
MTGKLESQGKAHPRNAAGPFYIRSGECMACGAPEGQAPTMMSHDERGHCFFVRQPSTENEIDEAILGLWVSCCGAVRYRGQNGKILTRFAEQGLAEQCDYRLDELPKRVLRNHMLFEFRDAKLEEGNSAIAHEIMDFFLHSLPQQSGDVRDFLCSARAGSFCYEWGDESQPHLHSIVFTLEPQSEHDWLLRMLRNENAMTAFAVSIHKAVRHDSRFRKFEWFSEQEWQRAESGVSCPY